MGPLMEVGLDLKHVFLNPASWGALWSYPHSSSPAGERGRDEGADSVYSERF